MILILTQCFPSRLGGIESLVSNLSLNLSKDEKVIVFADRHHIFYDAIYDNKYKNQLLIRRTSGLKFFRRRKKIKEVKLLINSNKVKLIISDTWKSLELGIDYFNQKKIPTLCLAHGNEFLSSNHKKIKRIQSILNKVSSIVTNSQFTKKLVENLIGKKSSISFVYPGANDLRNNRELQISDIGGSPLILTLARLEKRKGHSFVIDSIKKLKKDFPNIQYIIAGDGPEKKSLKKLVEKYDLNFNVKFVGIVNEDQKKFLFQRTDLMVMPTLDESYHSSIEGFGIAYIEAAFFGIPSIASNIGGTSEAVIHNSTGIIINNIDELYNSMMNLLKDRDMIKKLGKNAQSRSILDFNWNSVIKNYSSIIKKSISL